MATLCVRLRNTSEFHVWETFSEVLGLCHTIQRIEEVSRVNLLQTNLTLKQNNIDVQMFIHTAGDEFWMVQAVFPVPVDTILLGTHHVVDFLYTGRVI
jgi:hypothetical protein